MWREVEVANPSGVEGFYLALSPTAQGYVVGAQLPLRTAALGAQIEYERHRACCFRKAGALVRSGPIDVLEGILLPSAEHRSVGIRPR